MATAAGESTAAAAAENSSAAYEGGGAGGKFRKRPFRRNQTTPYDRPPTALRNPSWLTKLVVDPASKLITSGAQRFFSSFFHKRLPPPPTPLPSLPGPSEESKDPPQESSANDCGVLVVAGQEGGNAACISEGSAFSELEKLLKQKTFTRAESDRLKEVLRSKTVDMPIGYEEKRTEPIQSRLASDFSISLLEENRSVKVTPDRVVATPIKSSRVVEDDVASPAELAKAYMGSRPSKVSPSMLSIRSQIVREETPLLRNVPYAHYSPIPSVSRRTASLVGVRENGFTTPRSHGRSAIYSMARTPYSRVHQTVVQKASNSTKYDYGGPSSSQSVLENDGFIGSKQVLKRRSYVLDDDIGSVGPMRRIRQKHSFISQGVSRPSPGVGGSSAANQHREVSIIVGDDHDSKTTPTRHVAIPPKSSQTAAKILEHLERMTPKEKSSESKLAAGKERTPTRLTPSMLHGQALRSMEDLDSPKLLQSAQDSHKLENWSKVLQPNARDLKLSGKEQNERKSLVNEPIVIAKNDTIFSFKDAQSGGETNSLDNRPAAQPQKKRAFKMSAHEDSFELDEDIISNGPAYQSFEGKGKLKLSADEPLSKPTALVEAGTPLGILSKQSDKETPDAGAITVKNTGSLPSASSQSLQVNPPAFTSNKPKETTVDKVPPFVFSSSTPQSTGSKPETSSSLPNLASPSTDDRRKLFESDNSQKAGDSNGKLEASGVSTSISASGIFSFAAPSSTSSLSNGQFAPSSTVSTTSLLASSNFSKDVSSRSSSDVVPLTSIASGGTTIGTFSTPAGSLFGSTAASSVSAEPLFKFGSSAVPAPSTTSSAETAEVKAKAETGTTFGNLKSSHFAAASTGSSIFGSSSVMSTVTTSGTQSQGSVFSLGGETSVSAQTSLAGSSIAAVSHSMPSHFGSSSSSPSIGNSGITTSTLFGSGPGTTGQASASSVSNPAFSSNAASGIFTSAASSAASSAAGSSIGPNSGMTPLAFTFGASSAAPASGTSALATSSSATPSLFSFGSSSASSTNAVNTSSSATPSVFNFGGSSSSSSTNAANTLASPGIFSFGASSSTSSTNVVNTSTTATPSIFSFGASSSASSTNASSTVNPSPFTFGATSAASQTSSTAGVFGSSWQPPKSPGFSSPFSASTASGFTFGASSSSFAVPSTSPVVFGSAPSASSGSAFLFGSTTSTNSSSQPMFGNTNAFSASPGNNDQMSMEDSMAEDPVQASAAAVPFGQPAASPSPGGFGQPAASPSPGGFVFGSTSNSFQFGGQPSQAAPQNSSPFTASASGSLDFGAGGSFSLGSSGPDKSGRKIVKVNRNKNRRK